MAKHYGRNKRRKDRDEIAYLRRVAEVSSARAAEATKRFRELEFRVEQWDRDIQRLLGDYSMFRMGTQRELIARHAQRRRMAIPNHAARFAPLELPDTAAPLAHRMNVNIITLSELCTSVKEDGALLAHLVRVIYDDGATKRYCLNTRLSSDFSVGLGEHEFNWISGDIANQFVASYNRDRNKPRET